MALQMMIADSLVVLGLAISTIAAILMYRFPLDQSQYTEDGGRKTVFADPPTPDGRRITQRHNRCSKLALPMLIVGFALQLFGVVLQIILR
jgi:hypothetical protein